MRVGMYNLNCIYDGEWEIAKCLTVKSSLWSCNAIFMLIINDIACCILGKECRFYTAAFVIKIIIPRQVRAKTANIFMNNAELCLSCVCHYKNFHKFRKVNELPLEATLADSQKKKNLLVCTSWSSSCCHPLLGPRVVLFYCWWGFFVLAFFGWFWFCFSVFVELRLSLFSSSVTFWMVSCAFISADLSLFAVSQKYFPSFMETQVLKQADCLDGMQALTVYTHE